MIVYVLTYEISGDRYVFGFTTPEARKAHAWAVIDDLTEQGGLSGADVPRGDLDEAWDYVRSDDVDGMWLDKVTLDKPTLRESALFDAAPAMRDAIAKALPWIEMTGIADDEPEEWYNLVAALALAGDGAASVTIAQNESGMRATLEDFAAYDDAGCTAGEVIAWMKQRASDALGKPHDAPDAAPRPTIQDYRAALDALLPLAHDRAADMSEIADEDGEDGNHDDAKAAWEAIEAARALMAGHAPDAAPAAPQTPDASALMLAALKEAQGVISELSHQCGQMRGMFSDDDGTIAEAIEEGEAAFASIAAAIVAAEGREG